MSQVIQSFANPMLNPFPVLVVSTRNEYHALFDLFLSGVGYIVHHASTLAEAAVVLRNSTVPVILSERTLPDGSWVGVCVSCGSRVDPPLVIVLSNADDTTFWAQAFNLGAFDALHRTLEKTITDRALKLANLRVSTLDGQASSSGDLLATFRALMNAKQCHPAHTSRHDKCVPMG